MTSSQTTTQTSIGSDAQTHSVIQNDIASNIFVEAGAGTGKTYSLVQRIVAMLKSGVAIDEIMAITFTRAAASELRSRIRAELEDLRAQNPSEPHITSALEGVDTAAFQTIDSLVYSVLREYPLDAGLPPAIEIQNAYSELQMFRERWRQWSVETLEKDENFSKALSTAMRLKMPSPFDRINELANAMNEKHGEMRHAEFPTPQRIGIETIIELDAQISQLQSAMYGCNDHEDGLYTKLEAVVDWYSNFIAWREPSSEDEAEEMLSTWPNITPGRDGRAPNWGGSAGKAEAVDALKSVGASIRNAFDAARQSITNDLFRYARRFVNIVVEERRRAGAVTYYDSMTWLNDMLGNHAEIRRTIQRRYPHILVDEFQDTDPNQVRLVRLLTIPPGATTVTPGSLFIVGDPKQSIYKFRGAQVEVSQGVKNDITNDNAGGKYLTLRENRRSTRAIINWVNHLFGKWMPVETDQAEWIPLDMATETATTDNFGNVFHFGEPIKTRNVLEVRQSDASEVAMIARAVCAGALRVRDRHDNIIRPSRPGDLTILTRARSSWEAYTRELDALKLPYEAVIGGAAVLVTQEFRDLLNCLAAIDDPSDQPATVGALKSPHFGCTDVELNDWATAGGRFSCTAEFPADLRSSTGRDSMRILRKYNRLRDELQPAVLIERFIRERQTRELTFLETDPAPGLRRLDLAVELARQFTEEGATSLRECLARFSQLKESDEAVREEPSLEFDQGKIRFMTMHSSKGLEFPVVILADLCREENNQSPKLLVGNRTDQHSPIEVGVRLGGSKSSGFFQTWDYEDLVERDSAADALENTRLHYVAATRARDYLFVSRFRKDNDKKTAAALIDNHAAGNSSIWSPVPQEWKNLAYAPPESDAPTDEIRLTDNRDAWIANHEELLTSASDRPWISPSALKLSQTDDASDIDVEKPDFTPIPDTDEPTARGRAATSIGSAVHAAVQRCIEINNANVDQIARSEAEKHGVADRVDEVIRLTTATLNMPLLRSAAMTARDDVWVETPVAVPLPTINGSSKAMEGRVDLIYRLGDGSLGIADLKTDRSFDRSIDEMAEPYIPQLGAYAYAVQKATGIPVSEASLLFSRLAADNHGDGEYKLKDVESAIQLALELAAIQ